MTDSTRDWAEKAARSIEIEYGTSWPIAGLAVYLRELVANREAFARMQGRAQGMREAAGLCKSEEGEGDLDFIAFTLFRRADAIERGE